MRRLLLLLALLLLPGGAALAAYAPTGSESVSSSVSAGTGCPSTGTTLSAVYSVITSAASGNCVTLPAKTNTTISVVNRSGSAINIFPPSGGKVESLGTNVSTSLPVNITATFVCTTATQCYQTNLGISSVLGTRLVIGNYTLDTAAYGLVTPPAAPSAAQYQQDIVDAQSVGIDGFELDMQGWGSEASYFNYQNAFANMFTAAHNLANGFKLYLFIDCQQYGNPICSGAAATAMTTYSTDSAYLQWNGKPFLSAFRDAYNSTTSSSDEVFWHGVYTAITGAGITPFYVPSFYDDNNIDTSVSLATYTTDATNWYINNLAGDSNGLGIWSIDTPQMNLVNQDAIAAVMATNSKIIMPAVVPFFAQLRLLFLASSGAVGTMEQHGAEGMINSWLDIIYNIKPQIVHIQTWNDHTESYADLATTATLVADDNAVWTEPAASLWTHAAYAVLNQYFTQWYHTGVQPTNWPDSMYVFYRNGACGNGTSCISANGLTGLVPSAPPSGTTVNWNPDGQEPTLDDIYITTILKSPGRVTVNTGSNTVIYIAPAGIYSNRIPFAAGTQTFTLDRGGSALVSITGANINTSETTWYNVNPLAYYGHNP